MKLVYETPDDDIPTDEQVLKYTARLNHMAKRRAQQVIAEANKYGWTRIGIGFVWNQEFLIEEQKDWGDEHAFKNFDFTSASNWFSDEHSLPFIPINNADDLVRYFEG